MAKATGEGEVEEREEIEEKKQQKKKKVAKEKGSGRRVLTTRSEKIHGLPGPLASATGRWRFFFSPRLIVAALVQAQRRRGPTRAPHTDHVRVCWH